MNDGRDDFEISVEVLAEGRNAIKVLTEHGDEAWIPHSQIRDGSDVENSGDEGVLIIPKWLARKEGWV
jgi:hypothetical protein